MNQEINNESSSNEANSEIAQTPLESGSTVQNDTSAVATEVTPQPQPDTATPGDDVKKATIAEIASMLEKKTPEELQAILEHGKQLEAGEAAQEAPTENPRLFVVEVTGTDNKKFQVSLGTTLGQAFAAQGITMTGKAFRQNGKPVGKDTVVEGDMKMSSTLMGSSS